MSSIYSLHYEKWLPDTEVWGLGNSSSLRNSPSSLDTDVCNGWEVIWLIITLGVFQNRVMTLFHYVKHVDIYLGYTIGPKEMIIRMQPYKTRGKRTETSLSCLNQSWNPFSKWLNSNSQTHSIFFLTIISRISRSIFASYWSACCVCVSLVWVHTHRAFKSLLEGGLYNLHSVFIFFLHVVFLRIRHQY